MKLLAEIRDRRLWRFSVYSIILGAVLYAGLFLLNRYIVPKPPSWCDERAVETVKRSPADKEGLNIHQAVWRLYDLLKMHYHSMRVGPYRTSPVEARPEQCEVRLKYSIDDHPFMAVWTLDRGYRIVDRNREAKLITRLETRH